MTLVSRALKAVAAALALAAYVWVAAVRSLPQVKARKAARRRLRQRRRPLE